jgi:hypothetical protein
MFLHSLVEPLCDLSRQKSKRSDTP